jgi:hypothetical protein
MRCRHRGQRIISGFGCLFEGLVPAASGSQSSPKTSRWHAHQTDPGPFNAHSTDGGGSGLVQHVLRLPARTPPWNPHERELCAAPVSVKRCTLSHIGQPHGSGADLLLFQSQDRLADNSEWDEWRLLRCHVGQFLGSALCSAVGDWSLLGSRSPTQESGSSPTVRTPRRVYGSRS